jgi:hypothetical protein
MSQRRYALTDFECISREVNSCLSPLLRHLHPAYSRALGEAAKHAIRSDRLIKWILRRLVWK